MPANPPAMLRLTMIAGGRRALVLIFAILLVPCASPAQNQSAHNTPGDPLFEQCRSGPDPYDAIDACTEIIGSSGITDDAREYAYMRRALARLHLWDLERAIDDFDQVLEYSPDLPAALVSRGVAYQRLDMFDRAIEDFERSIDRRPDYILAFGARGAAYCLMGETEHAYEDFLRYLLGVDRLKARANFLTQLTTLGYEGPLDGKIDAETLGALQQLTENGCRRARPL